MISWIVSGLVVLWASRFAVVVGECVSNCQEMANGDYQSCNGCNVYVTCSNGYTYDNRPCPGALVWDDTLKRCEYTSTTCSGNPCQGIACQNGGTCTVNGQSFMCTCAAGWTGTTCETVCTGCSPNPCNGGTCSTSGCSHSCDCSGTNPLQSGDDCEFLATCDSTSVTASKSVEAEFMSDHQALYNNNGEITAVEVFVFEGQVRGIRVRYGSVWSSWEGEDVGASPSPTQTLALAAGETITGVSGQFGELNTGDKKERLSTITFTTTAQTWGPWGTTPTADVQPFNFNDGTKLAYIDGMGHKSGGIGQLSTSWADCNV